MHRFKSWRAFHEKLTMNYKTLCGDAKCPLSRGLANQQAHCSVAERLQGCLEKYFQHSSFRPGQLASTAAILHGRDVFVRMATGGGKSLCIFLPPLAVSDTAMGIVISPLVGLMDQQVSQASVFSCMKNNFVCI